VFSSMGPMYPIQRLKDQYHPERKRLTVEMYASSG
jgi:hypothetical protein